jgi:hypothetical protein
MTSSVGISGLRRWLLLVAVGCSVVMGVVHFPEAYALGNAIEELLSV